jgi:riboflavin kinase/FMN adenylyltransferase
MPHYRSLDGLHLENTWLTIGIFDGVHLGHRALLSRLVDGGQTDFAYLTPPDEKAARLTTLGVDAVITLPFSLALAAETAEDFMRRLALPLGLRRLLIGYDFALGRGREGNPARLAEIGQRLGYTVETFAPVLQEGRIISSTAIRAALAAGEVAEAARLLGDPYSLSGLVVHGDGRGRHINVPTANLRIPPEKLIPAKGIYATWARVGRERFAAATNIGTNPTFTPEKQTATVETHLLDFNRSLYGQEVTLEFIARLRDEMKFPSVEALLQQIRADIARVREILT